MTSMVEISGVRKVYDGGFEALRGVDLTIKQGEILALLGPNGAGKTTLISAICGIVTPSDGTIRVGGYDTQTHYRETRSLIGLVPQEIALEPFEKVMNTVRFSRGLFGKKPDPAYLEDLLRRLSLWDKRDTAVRALSGGMKRRVLIAKALSHDPKVLFLDEPTAGVDVELRRDMWEIVADLRKRGTTIILTTHYIEEAEEIADRIGVILKGEILLVEDKDSLMARMGQKELRIELDSPITSLPEDLTDSGIRIEDEGRVLVHTYDTSAERSGIASLMAGLSRAGIVVRDVDTRKNSLEDIFVGLVHEQEGAA